MCRPRLTWVCSYGDDEQTVPLDYATYAPYPFSGAEPVTYVGSQPGLQPVRTTWRPRQQYHVQLGRFWCWRWQLSYQRRHEHSPLPTNIPR